MHAVVTGGASGIGAACVASLRADGHAVTSFDVGPPRDPIVGVTYETVDVVDVAAVAHAMESASSREPVSGLVNSAGIRGGDERAVAAEREARRAVLPTAERRRMSIRAFEAIDTDSFERMMRVHVLGTFNTMQAVLPEMLDREHGSIVNISSMCGIIGCEVAPHYSAAKAAVIGLTKSIVRDVSRSAVRVNVVAPGYVRTPMQEDMDSDRAEALYDQIPMARFGEVGEVASLVTYLLGPTSSYITGQVISPSGGQVL